MTGEDAHDAAIHRRETSAAYRVSQRLRTTPSMQLHCECVQPVPRWNGQTGPRVFVCQRCHYIMPAYAPPPIERPPAKVFCTCATPLPESNGECHPVYVCQCCGYVVPEHVEGI